jgi:hypothetical protein
VLFAGSSVRVLWKAEVEQLGGSIGGDLYAAIEKGAPLHRAMILTQGCDIVKPHPWISVAPVYDAAGRLTSNQIENVRRGQTLHLLAMLPPWRKPGEQWVADFRLEMPVEKTALLGKEPIAAFENPENYLLVSQRLGYLKDRPAVAIPCLELVAQPFFNWLRDHQSLADAVLEVRITQDHDTHPTATRLHVILNETEPLDSASWANVYSEIYPIAAAAGLKLFGIESTNMQTMTAHDFTTSMKVVDGESS